MLVWSAQGVASSTTTRYLPPGYLNATAPTTPVTIRAPVDCTLSHLYVHVRLAGGAVPNLIRYTLYVNGAPTLLQVAMLPAAVDGADVVNSVNVNEGDLLDLRCDKDGTIGSAPTDIVASVKLAAA